MLPVDFHRCFRCADRGLYPSERLGDCYRSEGYRLQNGRVWTYCPSPCRSCSTFFSSFYVLVTLLMILVILMQRPKSEGLGAAFGGGVTENIFGAQTTNVLTKITGWLAGIFFALTFALSVLYAHRTHRAERPAPGTNESRATAACSPGLRPLGRRRRSARQER